MICRLSLKNASLYHFKDCVVRKMNVKIHIYSSDTGIPYLPNQIIVRSICTPETMDSLDTMNPAPAVVIRSVTS
jgi:hypothetical protein